MIVVRAPRFVALHGSSIYKCRSLNVSWDNSLLIIGGQFSATSEHIDGLSGQLRVEWFRSPWISAWLVLNS